MRISDWSSDVCSSDLGEAVLRLVEIARHPAFALHASQKGQPHQIAGQIIGPVMIGAGDILRLATVFPAQQRTAMGAAILDDVDFAPGVPGDDDGTLADPGSLETVRLGNLAIEPDEIPRSEELRVGNEGVSTCRTRWSP